MISTTAAAGGSTDVTDRVGRLLGIASLDAATLAALETINAAQSGTWTVYSPQGWSVAHTPAAAAQATISKAAGAAGVKHVCTSISFSFCATGAAPAAAAPMTVSLRDGATGAGTVLWSQIINLPAVAGESRSVNIGGLAIVGTAATAMTLEFAAAGAANTQESVAMTGYDA